MEMVFQSLSLSSIHRLCSRAIFSRFCVCQFIFLIDSLSYWLEGALLRNTGGIGTDRGGVWLSPRHFFEGHLALDAHLGHQIRIKRRTSPSTSVGARAADGRAFMVARGVGGDRVSP